MYRHPLIGAVAASLALAGTPLAAQTGPATAPTPPRPTTPETTALTLGDVVVTAPAGPLSTRRILSSVDVVPAERIEGLVVSNNWELFGLVPGAQLTQFGQGTTSGKFSMRAFNGEGEINAVKLLIDGIPSNSNDGNMPYIDLAPRLDIESIEVVRGTNDPRYGLHAIAGSANIATRFGGNYAQARAGLGSFGTQELQAAVGIESGGFTQNYAISRQRTDGHRDHSAADATAFSGKWFFTPEGTRTRFGLIARRYEADAQEAGYLTAAQAAENPRQSPAHNATDEDRRVVSQVALQGESWLTDRLHAAAQAWMNQLDDRRFVKFSAGASQQERFVDERHVGASATLTWRAGRTAIGDVALSGGVDVERQDNRSERYDTVAQARTAQTRDQRFDFDVAGAFVQAVIRPTGALTVTPGWRVDRITGSYANRLNGQTYPVNDYGTIGQPKLSAVYALSPEVALYGNWGRTFQVGVGTAAYRVNQVDSLAHSVNDGFEAGVKFRVASTVDGRLAIWRQTASNEARRRLNDPANDAENIGSTRRQGVDLQLNARPMRTVALWAAVGVQRSEILKADAASAATEGREIDHVPRHLYGFGARWDASDAVTLSAWANGQGAYFLERTNATGRFGSQFTLNASALWRVTRQVDLELQVRNLTDRDNEYVWWDGAQSLHAPGAPRSVFVSAIFRH
ncbi:MAG: hypothetical protein RIS35_1974 [Pseudomonadota bacterium]|jgi:iron complex outermembrane receptor protein